MNGKRLFILALLFSSACQSSTTASKPEVGPTRRVEGGQLETRKGAAAKPESKPEAKPAPALVTPRFPNANCPIMHKPASEALYLDTAEGRIYVCCLPCIDEVRGDVSAAAREAWPATQQVENRLCPVTGKPVPENAPKLKLQGYEFSLCSQGCVERARQNSQATLARLMTPGLTDLRNERCPLTREPVVNEVCVIESTLIHLSSSDCLEHIASQPREVLNRAKEQAETPK